MMKRLRWFHIGLAGLVMPFTVLAKPFGFVIPPPPYFIALALIVIGYLLVTQIMKRWLILRFVHD